MEMGENRITCGRQAVLADTGGHAASGTRRRRETATMQSVQARRAGDGGRGSGIGDGGDGGDDGDSGGGGNDIPGPVSGGSANGGFRGTRREGLDDAYH
jgi:hypothetical protein